MCFGFPAVGIFFFSSWLTMIFWGIVAPGIGLKTIGYPTAMLITIGLWLVVAPLFFVLAKRNNNLWFVNWNIRRPDNF